MAYYTEEKEIISEERLSILPSITPIIRGLQQLDFIYKTKPTYYQHTSARHNAARHLINQNA